MEKALSTFRNKPVLGYFNNEKGDLRGHDSDLRYDSEYDNWYFDYTNGKSETPLGVIRSEDSVEIVQKDGLNWIKFTCVLWTKYCYKQVKKLLKDRRKSVSVEIEVVESHMENGIEFIDAFIFDGVSLLGNDVTPAVPLAHVSILDSIASEVFQKKSACLSFAYKELDKNNSDNANVDNNTFSTVHNSNPEPNSTSGPDFEQPVENEKDKEITMKTEKGGENVEEFETKLTNENKADLLSTAVREALPDNGDPSSFAYLADFDDEFLYYCLNGTYYKAPYSIDTSTTPYAVNIALDEATPVIRSWDSYSDTKNSDMDKKDMKKMEEECPECHKPMSECECDKKQNEACDDKQVEEKIDVTVHSADEGKEECSTENKEECSEGEGCEKECNSTEDKKECAKEECAEEKECNSVDPEDGTHVNHSTDEGECEKECNSAEEKECNSEDGECSEKECNSEDGKEECSAEEKECNNAKDVECNSAEDKQCEEVIISPDTYSVDGEMISGAQLFEKFTALQNAYNQLQEKFSAKMQEEFKSFAYDMVKDEVDLSEDNAKAIFSQIDEACNSKKFSAQDEVEDYTTSLIAKALYSQKKEARKSAKEYSSNIVKNQNTFSGSNNSDVDELKSVNDKLKNL